MSRSRKSIGQMSLCFTADEPAQEAGANPSPAIPLAEAGACQIISFGEALRYYDEVQRKEALRRILARSEG